MDQQQTQETPAPEGDVFIQDVPEEAHAVAQEEQDSKTPMGPLVGAIIVIALLAFGALYFWSTAPTQDEAEVPLILGDDDTTFEEESGLPPQETSDESIFIEADANSMDMASFEMQMEQDMQAFEEEFAQ